MKNAVLKVKFEAIGDEPGDVAAARLNQAAMARDYWVVMPMPQDVREGVRSAAPLANFGPTEFWQAQSAMVSLQRRNIRCYMDLTTVYERNAA